MRAARAGTSRAVNKAPRPEVVQPAQQHRPETSERKSKKTTTVITNQICDICAQNVPGPERDDIIAFGRCDHHVCYVCSARLRVICDQPDCPICRDKLENVIFSKTKDKLYSKFNLSTCLYDEKHKIYFEDNSIKLSFEKLLRYECLECAKKFSSSKQSSVKQLKAVANTNNKSSTEEKNTTRDSITSTDATGVVKSSSNNGRQRKRGNKDNSTGRNDCSIQSKSYLQQDVPDSTNMITKNSVDPENNDTKEFKVNGGSSSIAEDSSGLLADSDLPRGVIFNDVLSLKNHLNYVHKLRLCDLCLTHNKLFPYEYSYYDASALKKHMKEGEPKTSHRGHPNCQLCHDTFFNMEELLIHMSREHFHCHICSRQETNLRYYFLDYMSLRDHFRNSHFLCEKGNCRVEQFTSAFENNIEYQFHLVNVHGNPSATRGESRQQRTITLDSAPHRSTMRGSNTPNSQNNRNRINNHDSNMAIVTTGQMATANDPQRDRAPENILSQLRHQQQRLPSRNEFPVLGQNQVNPSEVSMAILPTNSLHMSSLSNNNNYGPTSAQMRRNLRIATMSDNNNYTPTNEAFPAMLPSASSSSSAAAHSFVRTLGGGHRAPERLDESDFPPLPEQPKQKSKSNKGQNKTKANQSSRSQRDMASEMTLDQLIRTTLALGAASSSSNKTTGDTKKKSKNGANAKSLKHKPLKFQLS